MFKQRGWRGAVGGLLLCAVVGGMGRRAECGEAAGEVAATIGAITTQTSPGADGEPVTQVTITGSLGDVTFNLNQKEMEAAGLNKMETGIDMSALTKLYTARAQERMGATEEEWKLLRPRIHRVQQLRTSLRNHGHYGGSGGASAELQKAWKELSALIANKEATSEEVAPALKAVNDAEAAVAKELKQAREELRELLTVKQEAILVQSGILD